MPSAKRWVRDDMYPCEARNRCRPEINGDGPKSKTDPCTSCSSTSTSAFLTQVTVMD